MGLILAVTALAAVPTDAQVWSDRLQVPAGWISLDHSTSHDMTSHAPMTFSQAVQSFLESDQFHLDLTVALPLQNTDTLERLFYEVSTPMNVQSSYVQPRVCGSKKSSPNTRRRSTLLPTKHLSSGTDIKHPRMYGEHLTFAEVNDLTRPLSESVSAVKSWLSMHPSTTAPRWTGDEGMVAVSVSKRTAETMLGSRVQAWLRRDVSDFLLAPAPSVDIAGAIRAGQIAVGIVGTMSLPEHVQPHVTFVHGTRPKFTIRHISPLSPRSFASFHPIAEGQVNGDPAWTPQQLCAFLGMNAANAPLSTAAANAANAKTVGQTVLGLIGQTFLQSDVDLFVNKFGLPRASVAEVGTGSDYGNEAALDVQWMLATSIGANASLATQIKTTFLNFDGYSAFMDWVQYISSHEDVGSVHSASYDDQEYATDKDYQVRLNQEFQKAGVRGMSLFVASGDNGTGCRGDSRNPKCKWFSPDYPASSPYITSVGGTSLQSQSQSQSQSQGLFTGHGDDQPVFGASFSGGGFSFTAPRPDYQAKHVDSYLKTASAQLPAASYWNRTGRGYPDMAGPFQYYPTFTKGKLDNLAGTSGAAPVVAGLFTRVNFVRAQQGRPPLGFVNLLAYNNPSAFLDAVGGRNDGTPLDSSCEEESCGKGFVAIKGWDPVTGLGVPQYDKLVRIALQSDNFC